MKFRKEKNAAPFRNTKRTKVTICLLGTFLEKRYYRCH